MMTGTEESKKMLRGERLWKQLTFPANRQAQVHSRTKTGDH